jgi:hypothetical protein
MQSSFDGTFCYVLREFRPYSFIAFQQFFRCRQTNALVHPQTFRTYRFFAPKFCGKLMMG